MSSTIPQCRFGERECTQWEEDACNNWKASKGGCESFKSNNVIIVTYQLFQSHFRGKSSWSQLLGQVTSVLELSGGPSPCSSTVCHSNSTHICPLCTSCTSSTLFPWCIWCSPCLCTNHTIGSGEVSVPWLVKNIRNVPYNLHPLSPVLSSLQPPQVTSYASILQMTLIWPLRNKGGPLQLLTPLNHHPHFHLNQQNQSQSLSPLWEAWAWANPCPLWSATSQICLILLHLLPVKPPFCHPFPPWLLQAQTHVLCHGAWQQSPPPKGSHYPLTRWLQPPVTCLSLAAFNANSTFSHSSSRWAVYSHLVSSSLTTFCRPGSRMMPHASHWQSLIQIKVSWVCFRKSNASMLAITPCRAQL